MSAHSYTREVGERIAAWCRSQESVTWQHQGRRPWEPGRAPGECGLDCVGLPICGGQANGFDVEDMLEYSETPTAAEFMRCVQANCDPVEGEGWPGDLLLFWVRMPLHPQHAMVDAGDGRAVHASRLGGGGKVIVCRIDDGWKRRFHSRHRLKAERLRR